MSDESDASIPACLSCRNPQEFLGVQPIRMGGAKGLAVAFFGNLAEGQEWIWDVALFRCTSCGRIDFYDKDSPVAESAKRASRG